MADVQLEHGHLRIANRLAEALLDAEFSGVQFKMLHSLIRLTYGWRRRTVTLSHAEFAEYMHTSASGNFRASLRELIAEGVVIQAERGGGGKRSTYAIEKDFTKWGRFEVGAGRLARIYGERPDSEDDALFQSELFKGVPESGESIRPNQAEAPARIGRELAPESGIPTGSKSLRGESVAPRKDSERQEKDKQIQNTTPPPVISIFEEQLIRQAGEDLPDLKRWMDERPFERRADWARELLRIMGPSTGVTGADLAAATRQARLATPPATNVKALEVFALSCRDARTRPRSTAPPKPSERTRPKPTNSAAAPYAAALSGDDE